MAVGYRGVGLRAKVFALMRDVLSWVTALKVFHSSLPFSIALSNVLKISLFIWSLRGDIASLSPSKQYGDDDTVKN